MDHGVIGWKLATRRNIRQHLQFQILLCLLISIEYLDTLNFLCFSALCMFSAICNMCNALLMQNDLLQLFPSQKLEIENHKLCATVKTNYGASCNRTSAPRQPWRQSPHVIWNNESPYLPCSRCPAPPLPCPQSVQSHLYPANTNSLSSAKLFKFLFCQNGSFRF